jgi:uncharacterized protein YbbC (DUF1343 family)
LALLATVRPASAQPLAVPEIDTLLANAIAARALPGAVVVVGRRAGVLFTKAYGQRALIPAREAMTLDTIFDVASLTKPVVTTTLALQLVAAGTIELDGPAARYLPELARWNGGAASVRHLLVHGSGLPAAGPLAHYTLGPAAALGHVLTLRPLAPAGARFFYSDLGMLVLGQLIERVAGRSLDALAQERIFEPLAMRDSTFKPDPRLVPRIAPTERIGTARAALTSATARERRVIRGEVHDPRAFRLGGVAGHAGLFTTASDLARFARMLLGHGTLDGAQVLPSATLDRMTTPQLLGSDVRALGWDMRTRYSKLRGSLLSHRAFGHGGFTGGSLWVDPDQDLFVILLSNRVHPDGKGRMIELAGAVADAAVRATESLPAADGCGSLPAHVLTGSDVLRRDGFRALAGRRVGLIAHNASRARDGSTTLALLQRAPGVQLTALFAPEHGLSSSAEGAIASSREAGLPVHSLFGRTRKPTAEMLRGLDALVFDLADVGTRFFTYMSTLRYLLEAAAEAKLELFVLDRPNPLGADRVEGPVLAAGIDTFVNYHRLPVVHGMTAGELALLLNAERAIGARLHVIAMEGYSRELRFTDTDLTWFPPSPNLPTPSAALLYPATGLLESMNLSVGRGTDRPFEVVCAPWLDGARLASALARARLPGVSFSPHELTPRSDRYRGELCRGVLLHVDDPRRFHPVRTGLTIAAAIREQARAQLRIQDLGKLLGEPRVLAALIAGTAPRQLERLWEGETQRFEGVRRRHLLYPYCAPAR